jgi:hypothetical protein
MRDENEVEDEERDSVAPEPEFVDPADAGGDSPGPDIGVPDDPLASDKPGTTVVEQREPSLEHRLEIERPDVMETAIAGTNESPSPRMVDDDVPTDELNVDDPAFDPAEAEMDRTGEEAAEQSSGFEEEGPEGDAMHVEPG